MNASRRHMLALIGIAPALGVVAGQARPQGAACYDSAALAPADRALRTSLGYVDTSGDPKRRCGLCTFFTAGDEGCGACQLMSGGPVRAAAACGSFAAKGG